MWSSHSKLSRRKFVSHRQRAPLGPDQAGIDCKTFSANQTLIDAAAQDGLSRRSRLLSRKRPWWFFEKVEWSGTSPSSPMRAYAEETNRLNPERRANGEGYRSELAKIQRTLKQMLGVIEEGGHTRGMTDRMRELEAREDALKELLAQERRVSVGRRSSDWRNRSTTPRIAMRRPKRSGRSLRRLRCPPARTAAKSTLRSTANWERS